MSNLIKVLESEFGQIETGMPTSAKPNVQIAKFASSQSSPRFISTLGLKNKINLTQAKDDLGIEWFMEFSWGLEPERAASVLDFYVSRYLNEAMQPPKRGSYVVFPKAKDHIWENDNINGLYFTHPIFRSDEFKEQMNNLGMLLIWVVPITPFEINILEKEGWTALELYWENNNVNLHSPFRINNLSASEYEEHHIGNKLLKLYKGLEADAFCKDNNILNICVIDDEGHETYISHIPGADNSPVVGIYDKGETVILSHWRGFSTILDKNTMEFIDQSFTK